MGGAEGADLSLCVHPRAVRTLQRVQQRQRPRRVVWQLLREEVIHDRVQPSRARHAAVLLEQPLQVLADGGGLAAGTAEECDALRVLLEVVVGLAEVCLEGHGAARERAEVRRQRPQRCEARNAVPARPAIAPSAQQYRNRYPYAGWAQRAWSDGFRLEQGIIRQLLNSADDC